MTSSPPPIPRGVWILGFVSLFADISSELVHSLLPVFMVSSLGASVFYVGVVEGVAESTALMVKIISGTLSDHLGRRKALVVTGYALGALSKPIFAMAGSMAWVFSARFIDRIGKGIRGGPRDALVADLTPPEIRGAAYGLRQSLDTVGAFSGPLLAIVLMISLAGDIRAVFWIAVLPGTVSVLLLLRLKEPARPDRAEMAPPMHWKTIKQLSRAYWWVVLVGSLFTLARFSEAFLILRAQQYGLSDTYAPMALVVLNLAYALTAYPAGKLADRMDHRHLLITGLAVLAVADMLLAQADRLILAAIGIAAWGIHLGLTQGLLATMVANAAPRELRGTAFGFFNLASGVCMLVSSILAGLLWDAHGAQMTFYCGTGFSLAAIILVLCAKASSHTPYQR